MFNRNTLLAACAALVLTACGGGGGSDGTPSNEIPDPISPVDPGKPDPVPEPEPEPKPKPVRLNDTGIQYCLDGADYTTAKDCADISVPRQDAHNGRDAQAAAGTLKKDGAGSKGFDFTKIANDGSELPATAELGLDPKQWACTRDNVTGLVWEVKVKDVTHLRHMDHTYVFEDDRFPDVSAGTLAQATDTCRNPDGLGCTSKHYVNSVNAVGLCGAKDWRLPSAHELVGIADISRPLSQYDPDYFPNMPLGDDYTEYLGPGAYAGQFFLSDVPELSIPGYGPYSVQGAFMNKRTGFHKDAILLVRTNTPVQTP